jgi:hypothetical protein
MTRKCTWGALVCATWLLVVVGLHQGNAWTGLLGIQFWVALIAGVVLALTGAASAVSDRQLAPTGRTVAISVGVAALLGVLLLILTVINDVSKLN